MSEGLDAVTISGTPGEPPELEWNAQLEAGDAKAEVVDEGDGAAYEDGDTAYINYVVGNGYSRETVMNSFGPSLQAASFTVGDEAVQPTDVGSLIAEEVRANLPDGVTRGTRIAITVGAEELFGGAVYDTSVTSLGIGNKDGLVIVADLLEPDPLTAPEGTAQPSPDWAPTLTYKAGKPTGFDFTGVPKPAADAKDAKTRKAVVKLGEGDRVQKGDLLVVNYLGQVYDGEKPFDESFTKEPFPTPIGLGAVVTGWDEGLVGIRTGSRVILEIPPADGYGDQEQQNIPAGSTLYFVVDILASY